MSVEAWAIKHDGGDLLLGTIRETEDRCIDTQFESYFNGCLGPDDVKKDIPKGRGVSCVRVRITEVKEGE